MDSLQWGKENFLRGNKMKYENEIFQDLMGVVIETENKWLDKKLNGHICYKGGGSSTATATIPEEFKPFAGQYSAMLSQKANQFGQIGEEAAPLKQAQEQALQRASSVRGIGEAGIKAQQEALTGTGMFGQADLSGMAKELSRQAGIKEASRRAGAMGAGTLGSARGRIAEAEGQAALQGQLARLNLEDLQARRAASAAARGETAAMQKAGMGDIDVLRGVGKEQTARAQMLAEAPVRGLKEMGSIFTGIPMGQTTTQSGGK